MRTPAFLTARSAGINRRLSGMTLLELLAVMAVIAMLATFTTPAFNALVRGSQLTQAAQLLCDQISLARQMALAGNRQIEVRIYKFADPEVVGEDPANPDTGKFRAIQLFEVDEDGGYRPVGKLQRLAGSSVIIDGGDTLSSIIGKAGSGTVPALCSGSALGNKIPRAGLNYTSVSFRFQPDGSANLSTQTTGQQWFLTVHEANKGDNLAAPPANFATVQINPANGKLQAFHP